MDWLPYVNGFWIFPLFCLLFMALMMIGHGARHGERNGTAAELLDRRYARGEIGKEQYEAMRRDLNG